MLDTLNEMLNEITKKKKSIYCPYEPEYKKLSKQEEALKEVIKLFSNRKQTTKYWFGIDFLKGVKMIKLSVNSCQLLKEFRCSHNVPSKTVVAELDKSNAYLSKLEKGDFRTIDESILLKILRCITKDETEVQDVFKQINDIGEILPLAQVISDKITELETYKNDYRNLIDAIADNIVIKDDMLIKTKEDAKNQFEIYKKELIELVSNMTLEWLFYL